MKKGQLYWITGLSGAGKTTIGKLLYQKLSEKYENIVFLDGDIMKKVFESTQEIDYSSGARKERAMKYARLCICLLTRGWLLCVVRFPCLMMCVIITVNTILPIRRFFWMCLWTS